MFPQDLIWKEDNPQNCQKKKRSLDNIMVLNARERAKNTLAREPKPPLTTRTTARARRQPELDSQSFPAFNCRRRQASTRVLAYLSQEKGSARSRTSRYRKGAPVAATDKEAHREPTCQALGRWQSFAESSPNPANARSSFSSGESTQKTPLERLFSPTLSRDFERDFSPPLTRD